MLSRRINHIQVFFEHSELSTAELICDSALKVLRLIHDCWGLEEPSNCSIYIMTSWRGFAFQSAPWPWQILLAATFPLWYSRVRHTWSYAAGWTQYYGRRVAIGIKPPRLLEQGDKSIGKLIFVEERDMSSKLNQIACHELTHACSARLKLPAWLNEGLAMLTVDRFLGKPTILRSTLELIRNFSPQGIPPSYRMLLRMQPEAIAYYTSLSYWLVRYLEEVHPGFLKRLLTSSPASIKREDEIITEVGVERGEFWSKVPGLLITHFSREV